MNLTDLTSPGVSSCRVLHISSAGSSLLSPIGPSATPAPAGFSRAKFANPVLAVLVYHRPSARPSPVKGRICSDLDLPTIDRSSRRDSIF